MELTQFVVSQLPPPPARILEVGCGRGELARRLADAGHDVTAIDPAAPEGAIFRPLKLEDMPEDEPPYDVVVAVRSLHHVSDLSLAFGRIAALLLPAGRLVLEEFGWDRLDVATAEWFHGQLRVLAAAGRAERAAPTLEACCRDWEEEHVGLYGYADLRAELDRRFEERLFEWRPYLHRLLDGIASEALEETLIETGAIQATGFRYVGVPLRD